MIHHASVLIFSVGGSWRTASCRPARAYEAMTQLINISTATLAMEVCNGLSSLSTSNLQMDKIRIVKWLILTSVIVQVTLSYSEHSEEVCLRETFHARCPRGEVIIITKADYGHIKVGRCVQVETEHLGCKEDVTRIVSNHCDGKNECQVREDDDEITVLQPCSQGIYMYLAASYICIAAKQAKPCESITVSNDKTYLSSKQSQVCPGPASVGGLKNRLTASVGRKIEVSGIDFNSDIGSQSVEVGYLLDERTGDVTPLSLTPSGGRERVLLTSEGNTVILYLYADLEINFIILFRASGCEDMQRPRDMWLTRDQDQLTVGCHNSRKTWSLRCEGVHWRGVIGNCTKEAAVAVAEIRVVEEVTMALPRDVVLMIIFAGTAVIALIIVTTGYVTYRRSAMLNSIPRAEGALLHNNIKTEEAQSNKDNIPSQTRGPQYTLMRLQENPTQPQPPPVPPRKDNLSAQTTLLMSNP